MDSSKQKVEDEILSSKVKKMGEQWTTLGTAWIGRIFAQRSCWTAYVSRCQSVDRYGPSDSGHLHGDRRHLRSTIR